LTLQWITLFVLTKQRYPKRLLQLFVGAAQAAKLTLLQPPASAQPDDVACFAAYAAPAKKTACATPR